MNTHFESRLASDLDVLRSNGTYKRLRYLTTPMAAQAKLEIAGEVLVLCSNNYLGLARQPEVIDAGVEGLRRYGAGTASVRFICGTFDVHRALENRIASFLSMEAALTYSSCWSANEGLIPTIASAGSTILSDELNHASIIDGCRLSAANRIRYKHADMADLEAHLAATRRTSNESVFIITDGVFSMEGSVANLPVIVNLARRYDAVTIVDDSHGTGVMGKTGRGTMEHFGLDGKIDIVTGTLGKALGGAAGGFVAGSCALMDTLIQKSRTQLFSNAVPPAVACSAMAAIDFLDAHPERVQALQSNVKYLRAGLKRLGYKPLEGPSAIIPIMIGETARAIAVSDRLLEEGVFVTGFGHPVVPEGMARVRVQMSADFRREDLDRALSAFECVGAELGILQSGV